MGEGIAFGLIIFFLLIILAAVVSSLYEILAPISIISKEDETTTDTQKIRRQIRGIGYFLFIIFATGYISRKLIFEMFDKIAY
jgi:hypothetical protein